jgi:putative transposase
MPRVARIVIPGCAYHLTQRGNNRQDVFFVDNDRRLYLRMLAEECQAHGLDVLAYCLMANHVHLIATPAGEQSLAKGFGRANSCLPAGRSATPRRSTASTAAANICGKTQWP